MFISNAEVILYLKFTNSIKVLDILVNKTYKEPARIPTQSFHIEKNFLTFLIFDPIIRQNYITKEVGRS